MNDTAPLPQTAVRMVRTHARDLPDWPLPEGYSVRGMEQEDIGLWCDIWRDAENKRDFDAAYFRRQFSDDADTVRERCLLLEDERGIAVGTASAWYAADAPGVGMVHWVAIRPSQQGQGLSKPMMAAVLHRLAQWHDQMRLNTHAHRLAAIALYLRCGFEPDRAYDGGQHDLWDQTLGRLRALRG